ncbi:MAG: hypothetical protein GX591_02980 [Planctomycetes bacterium]|nr:hypothetical protein [Planctomycetota bacterium]
MNGQAFTCVHTAADVAEAAAILDALTAAGIDARQAAFTEDRRLLGIEIYVPVAREAQARAIIADGLWPRLA